MSDAFHYRDDALFAEDVALEAVAARFGTPTYVYSRAAIESRFAAFDSALGGAHEHLVCYAVKANSNLAVQACGMNATPVQSVSPLGPGTRIGLLNQAVRPCGDPSAITLIPPRLCRP